MVIAAASGCERQPLRWVHAPSPWRRRWLTRLCPPRDTGFAHLPKSDIFALGITLIELATATPAHHEGDEYHRLREGRIP
eukprot:COSAG01_NODE_28193_length_667_cov_0.480634_2_plen_79_part_01